MLRHFDSFDGYATADLAAQYSVSASGTIGAFGRNGTNALRDPIGVYKAIFQNFIPTTETFIGGAAYKFRTSMPFGFPLEIMSEGSEDLRVQFFLKIKTSGKLSINDMVDSAAVLAIGIQYYIQLKVLVSNTVGTCEVRVRDCTNAVNIDVSDLTFTNVDTRRLTQNGWDGFRISCGNVDVEDLYIADGSGSYNNDFLDDTAIDALIAQADSVAAGFNHGWTRSTGSDQGANVAKTTPAATPYNSTATIDAKDTYQLPSMDSTGGTRAVKANFYAWKTDNVPRQIVPVFRVAGADYEGTAIDVPANPEYLTQILETNPLSGAPWTNLDVAALELGPRYPTPATVTKLYLTNTAAPYTPATLRGAWDQTAGAVTKALDPSTRGGGDDTTVTIAETNVSTTFDVLLYRGVSGPLAAQTLGGTINLMIQVLESAALADMNWHIHAYVTQGDSDTPRGTILTDYVEALGVNEWPSGVVTFKALNAAQALSALAVSDGDRLVVELGYISREASATSRSGTISYGTLHSGMQLADGTLGYAGTNPSKAGFLQFSQAILMSATPAVRVSQVFLEVLSPNIPAVADPPGGGDPGTGTEPTNGTSLCNAVVYKTVRVQTDAGEKRYSYGDVPLGNTFREARVLSISPIRRPLSDTSGRIETARTAISLSDYDGSLRGLAASGTLLNKRVDVYAATDAQLRANATERRIASLIIRDFKFGANMLCTLQCEDYFGSILGEYAATILIPKRLFNTTDFPNLPVALIGKPVPIGYGLLSDEAHGATAIGVVPAIFVGARRLSDGLDWDEYVLFGHAAAAWQSVFASDLRDVALWDPASLGHGPRPVKMDLASLEGTEFLVPTHSGWTSIIGANPFVDHNGHRYAVIYVRGQRSLDARSGECPISVNVPGVEDVGDGSGTLITELWLQAQHFINNWWIQSYQTGNWFSIPSVNGYSRIATTTFAVANAAAAARLGGSPAVGYLGAWMLGQDGKQWPIATAMAQLARDGDGEFGNDRHGRIIASVIDASSASVRTFTDTYGEIEEGSFDANRRIANQHNHVTIKYQPNYILDPRPDSARTGVAWWSDFSGGSVNVSDATSIGPSGINEDRELKLEAWSIRDPATAVDIGAKKLARRKDGPIYTEFRTNLCGDDVDLGDNFKVTSQEGMDSTGWTAKLHRCEAITYYLDEDMVRLEGQAIT